MPLEKFCSEHFELPKIISRSRLYVPDLPFSFDGSAASVGSSVQSAEPKLLAIPDNTAGAMAPLSEPVFME